MGPLTAKKICLVGIGPGNSEHMTPRAVRAIKSADVVVGYKTYLSLIEEYLVGKEVISKQMRQEMERAGVAVDAALDGKRVAVISSGDPGVYAMTSAVFEYVSKKGYSPEIEIEVVPGVTAATASAALLGSPLGHDFAVISLSDLLTPWEAIEKRLVGAAKADFCIVLYNPKSSGRKWQIEKAAKVLLEHRSPGTPVGIVRNAMREGESVVITTLKEMTAHDIDMLTTIIIGNAKSLVYGDKIITPRGYGSKDGPASLRDR